MTVAGAPAHDHGRATVTAAAVFEGCDVDLVGVPTRLSAPERRAARALAAVLRYAPPASSQPRVQVRVVRRPPSVPPLASASLGPDIDTWRPRPGLLVVGHRDGTVAHATAGEIVIGRGALRFEATFRHVLVLALAHVLAQHGRQLLHAGAVAINGRAVIVLGGTGAGKSTLVLCAWRRGWSVLADDLVALRLRGGEPLVAGIPRPIVVPRDLLDADATAVPVRRGTRERCEVPAVVPSAGWHPVSGSLLAAHAEESGTSLDPFEGPERLRLVLGSFPAMADPAQRRGIFTLAGAIARRPGLTLRHSADPRTRLEDGMRGLDEARAELGLG